MEAGKDPRVDQHKNREGGGFPDPPDNSKTKPAPGQGNMGGNPDGDTERPGDSDRTTDQTTDRPDNNDRR